RRPGPRRRARRRPAGPAAGRPPPRAEAGGDPALAGGALMADTEDMTGDTTPAAEAIAVGPPPGAMISRFIVLRKLGAGGMVVVLSAHDTALDRKVAIKLLHPELRGGETADIRTARLLREAQAMARIRHPNVITVYEVGSIEDQVFIAMELIDGQSLA